MIKISQQKIKHDGKNIEDVTITLESSSMDSRDLSELDEIYNLLVYSFQNSNPSSIMLRHYGYDDSNKGSIVVSVKL